MRLLDAVLRKGLPLEAALDGATRELARGDDRAFAHAMVAETLRRLADLDALIDGATARPLPDDAKPRAALRLALVQALALGTPPHAAISTILPLVDGGPRRLVHGVFGAVMRSGARLPDLPALPPPVASRWEKAWGAPMVTAACRALATPPPLDLGFPAENVPDFPGRSLMPGHMRLDGGTTTAGLAASGEARTFAPGLWWAQDIAASMPARLLGEGGGRTALDLCAAPGGKTMQLATSGFAVTAVDVSESRLARLSQNLERTGISAEIVQADLLRWSPVAAADAILLDAPCSATGIFRRHPDVLYRVRPRIIAEMAELQARMIRRAADWLKPGGILVYSVCSLEPEEGEQVVEAFLDERKDFRIAPVRQQELAAGMAPAPQGWLRLLPGVLADEGGADSFFIARMRRD